MILKFGIIAMRLTNLDMDALRSFASGIDAGSFARAAERLGRSTSAISAQLKKLEEQAGTPLVRKSGRGLTLTDSGEVMLSYARRLLALNDEAVSALAGAELEGWARLGIQEDFGDTVLPRVLGRFARAHPKVRVEGRIARNAELKEKVAGGQLDLALAWDDGGAPADERIAAVPLCWLASSPEAPVWRREEPLPLVVLEAPCLLRTIACEALDRHGIPWRIAFVTPSLGGLWAATAAGLGVAVRTSLGRPATVGLLDDKRYGLPPLPSLGLRLIRSDRGANPIADHLSEIIREAFRESLPAEWMERQAA